MNRFAFLVLYSVMAGSRAAQQPATPAFEVASVKPSPNDFAAEGVSTSPSPTDPKGSNASISSSALRRG
jgi:hypothetical protein